MLKYLRIAVTTLSLTTCVLLIALWVRSYYQGDLWYVRILEWQFETFSTQGFTQSMDVTGMDDGIEGSFRLEHYTFPPDEPPSLWFDVNRRFITLGFTYVITAEGNYLLVRHWLAALLSSVIAIIPWVPWRFSLRTLLIATTLVAIVLGAVIYAESIANPTH